jgi:hypothetical protein
MKLIKEQLTWDLVKYDFGFEYINKWTDERIGIFKTEKDALAENPEGVIE